MLKFSALKKLQPVTVATNSANYGLLEALQIIKKEFGKNQSGIYNRKGVVGENKD